MAMKAADVFVGEIDGAPITIQKGTILPDSHPAVKLWGDTPLFEAWNDEPDEAPPKPRRGRPPRAAAAAADAGDGD